MIYKIRNVHTKQWAYGAAFHPKFAIDGGRTWNDLDDAKRWLHRYCVGYRLYRKEAVGDPLEIVVFKVREVRIIPETQQ